MQITRLRVYPVKSCAGEDVDSAWVNPWGLDQDRRWALVDDAGEQITARDHNSLLGIVARALTETVVQLTDRDGVSITVDSGTAGETIRVGHSRQGTAVLANGDVSSWLSERVGVAARLVWQPDPRLRSIAAGDGGQPGDVMSLADAAPLLLITESSRSQLDAWSAPDTGPLDAVRFRPNVVIDGAEPFAEENWTGVTVGDVRFRVTMICDRCVMTVIDPATLVRAREPIRTLATHRGRHGKAWFGIRLTPLNPGRISVGDRIEAMTRK